MTLLTTVNCRQEISHDVMTGNNQSAVIDLEWNCPEVNKEVPQQVQVKDGSCVLICNHYRCRFQRGISHYENDVPIYR